MIDNNTFQIIIYESDKAHLNFYPFSTMHCIWEIRCGALRLVDKVKAIFPNTNIAFIGREKQVASFLKKENLHNSIQKMPTLIVNAGAILDTAAAQQIVEYINAYMEVNSVVNSVENDINFNFISNNKTIACFVNHFSTVQLNPYAFNREQAIDVQIDNVNILNYLWESLDFTGEQIKMDLEVMRSLSSYQANSEYYPNVLFTNEDNVYLGEDVVIDAGTILDATKGPIIIDNFAKIMYNSVIVGPCYIGPECIIKIGAKIYGNCSFGKFCKIGGEVENSTFHSYSNKQHDGFIGHSYIGEWVNLGAGTSNSDLKNNYSKITVKLPHEKIFTNKQFLGILMGDHCKTAINSSFSTGSVVGLSTMVASSKIMPKYIPDFSWIEMDSVADYDIVKAIETAQIVMERRNKTLTKEEIDLFHQADVNNLFYNL